MKKNTKKHLRACLQVAEVVTVRISNKIMNTVMISERGKQMSFSTAIHLRFSCGISGERLG